MRKEKNKNNQPDEILIKYLTGSATEKERSFAKKWINENIENRRHFDELKDYYRLSKVIQSPSGYNKENAWNNVKASYYQIRFHDELKTKTNFRKKIILYAGLSSAAAIILAFILAFNIKNNIINTNQTAQLYNEVIVPLGSKSMITLSDSTKVWLNAGSKLRYPQNFISSTREVYLEGEGFFDVSKNKDKLFLVKTNGVNIKVFGTRFNVKSYPDENNIQTTLIEGSVAIEPASGQNKTKPIYLKPNQTATFYKRTSVIKKTTKKVGKSIPEIEKNQIEKIIINPKINTLPITSWKEKEWIFDGEELGNLAVKLERRYNVKISFENTNLISYKFTGTLTEETFEQVLKIIQLSAPILYEIEGNNVVLKEDPLYKKTYDKLINNPKK